MNGTNILRNLALFNTNITKWMLLAKKRMAGLFSLIRLFEILSRHYSVQFIPSGNKWN